jgi:uncharacterized FlaG/YvyC family protein
MATKYSEHITSIVDKIDDFGTADEEYAKSIFLLSFSNQPEAEYSSLYKEQMHKKMPAVIQSISKELKFDRRLKIAIWIIEHADKKLTTNQLISEIPSISALLTQASTKDQKLTDILSPVEILKLRFMLTSPKFDALLVSSAFIDRLKYDTKGKLLDYYKVNKEKLREIEIAAISKLLFIEN